MGKINRASWVVKPAQQEQLKLWNTFSCPECENVWESVNCSPVREWCECGTMDPPELVQYNHD